MKTLCAVYEIDKLSEIRSSDGKREWEILYCLITWDRNIKSLMYHRDNSGTSKIDCKDLTGEDYCDTPVMSFLRKFLPSSSTRGKGIIKFFRGLYK